MDTVFGVIFLLIIWLVIQYFIDASKTKMVGDDHQDKNVPDDTYHGKITTIYKCDKDTDYSEDDKLTFTFSISEKDLSTAGGVTKEKSEFIKVARKFDKVDEVKQPTSICRNLLKIAEFYAKGHGVDKNLKKSEEFFDNAIHCAAALYSESTRERKVKEFMRRKLRVLEKSSEEKILSSKPLAKISKYL